MSTILKTNYEFPFLSLNVTRLNDPLATDTVFCGTPTIDYGSNSSQTFSGKETLLSDIYNMKSDKQFASTLSNKIRQCGAIENLISDRAQVEAENKVEDNILVLFADD